MKLDRESQRWLFKKIMIPYTMLAALIIIMELVDGPFNEPLNLTVEDSLASAGLLLWGLLVLCNIIDALKMTREHQGLRGNWTNSAIDELEARIEKLERERP